MASSGLLKAPQVLFQQCKHSFSSIILERQRRKQEEAGVHSNCVTVFQCKYFIIPVENLILAYKKTYCFFGGWGLKHTTTAQTIGMCAPFILSWHRNLKSDNGEEKECPSGLPEGSARFPGRKPCYARL